MRKKRHQLHWSHQSSSLNLLVLCWHFFVYECALEECTVCHICMYMLRRQMLGLQKEQSKLARAKESSSQPSILSTSSSSMWVCLLLTTI
jgi:hypothetical protein